MRYGFRSCGMTRDLLKWGEAVEEWRWYAQQQEAVPSVSRWGGEIAFFSDGGVAIGQKRLTERLWFPRMPFGRIRLF
jgi:hypothetical protein